MRDYAMVSPRFWTGDTGRKLRRCGGDELLVALYLLTCPSATMIGLYHLSLPTLCHETGIPFEGALKALRSLSEAQFAHYDEERELVWVPEMARYQIGDTLKREDKRVKGVASLAAGFHKSPFYKEFCDKYAEAFSLHGLLPEPLAPSPFEAPSKPLRSQEQEQEQEQQEQQPSVPAAPAKAEDPEVEMVYAGWMQRSRTIPTSDKVALAIRKRIRQRLAEKFTPDQLLACVDFALRDEFYRSKRYAKQPDVIWRDASRVHDLLERIPENGNNGAGRKPAPSLLRQHSEASDLFVAMGDEVAE